MNARKKKFVSLPKHALDLKSMRETSEAVNSLLNSKIIIGQKSDVHHSDSNVVYEIPQQTFEDFVYPFKVYNIKNVTDPSKSAATFQIRDGLVGFRPQYVYPDENLTSMREFVAGGNYELPLYVAGTDGIFASGEVWQYSLHGDVDFSQSVTPNNGGSITFDGTQNPLLICSTQSGTANPTNVQIVIDPGASASFEVSFWIKIIDDVNGAYTELWASMADGASIPNFAADFQNIYQTIDIGLVSFEGGKYIISQCQYGHLLNRYLETAPNPTLPAPSIGNQVKFFGLPQIHRGKWTQNGLSGKLFYPGDQVIDDTTHWQIATTFPTSSLVVYKVWTYLGAQDVFGNLGIHLETVPPGDLTKWTPTGLCITT